MRKPYCRKTGMHLLINRQKAKLMGDSSNKVFGLKEDESRDVRCISNVGRHIPLGAPSRAKRAVCVEMLLVYPRVIVSRVRYAQLKLELGVELS